MTRVVVTGGAGYVGSVVTAHLLLAGHPVVVLDTLAGSGESLLGFVSHPMFRLVRGDVRNPRVVGEAVDGADAVVHLAAVVGEPACAADELNARSINADGTATVLAAVTRAKVPRFILVSTCSNYGVSSPDALADEDSPLHPLGVYARSKVEAERLVLTSRAGTSACVLRFGTICGLSARMRFDLLVNDMARAAVLGETIRIFAPEAWRPFLYIRDAARAIEWGLGTPDGDIAGRVYNVVGENYQKKGLVDLVRRRFPETTVEVVPGVPDPRDYRVSGARLQDEGRFSPVHTVEDAFMEVAAAVQSGVFRDPTWSGHAAAPPAPQQT